MSYYNSIDEDLNRAKAILAKGRPCQYRPDHNGECLDCDGPAEEHQLQAAIDGEVIYGADVYAAYKLLESFVGEIERLQRVAVNHDELSRRLTAETTKAVAAEAELQRFLGLFSDYEEPCRSFEQAQAIWNALKTREAEARVCERCDLPIVGTVYTFCESCCNRVMT